MSENVVIFPPPPKKSEDLNAIGKFAASSEEKAGEVRYCNGVLQQLWRGDRVGEDGVWGYYAEWRDVPVESKP